MGSDRLGSNSDGGGVFLSRGGRIQEWDANYDEYEKRRGVRRLRRQRRQRQRRRERGAEVYLVNGGKAVAVRRRQKPALPPVELAEAEASSKCGGGGCGGGDGRALTLEHPTKAVRIFKATDDVEGDLLSSASTEPLGYSFGGSSSGSGDDSSSSNEEEEAPLEVRILDMEKLDFDGVSIDGSSLEGVEIDYECAVIGDDAMIPHNMEARQTGGAGEVQ